MIRIAGYQISETVHIGKISAVYRARRASDRRAVVIKTVKDDHPEAAERARFRHEYELLRALNGGGAVQAYDLLELRRGPALVMEDGGQSLQQLLQNRRPTLRQFLRIALAAAGALDQVHRAQIVHKDINPANMLVDARALDDQGAEVGGALVRLLDFGLASRLRSETRAPGSAALLEGTLAYISPEQTGRMNRALDYRSDYYSLGVTLYEMLTGRLPFAGNDPLELVHGHIARRATPPHELFATGDGQPPPDAAASPALVAAVSALVMKLLAKDADDRYQSAVGLRYDLERLWEMLDRAPADDDARAPFEPGSRDVVARLMIPQRLYGRESDVAQLLAAFDRVAETGQSELLLVAGEAGVGKSSLVYEVHRPLTARRGRFIAGKFEQLQRNVPYAAVTQALNELCRSLLAAPAAELERWRARIVAALGANGRLICDVVPDLELVTGPQPPLPELGSQEAQHRFVIAFGRFVSAIADAEQPLVLFLDDMQWADPASLQLLSILAGPAARSLLVIAAYRDAETGAAHPFRLSVEQVKQGGTPLTTLELGNLGAGDLERMLADTLHCTPGRSAELAALVYNKTLGNPFFSRQFLQTLAEEQLLSYDPRQERWVWDVPAIKVLGITDNVVELLAGKLERLPAPALRMVQLAACIADRFDIDTLAAAAGHSRDGALRDLWPAAEHGFIMLLDEEYHYSETAGAMPLRAARFSFAHDRVQQAAYSLIDAAELEAIHLRIGRLLLRTLDAAQRDEHLFEIVRQLNAGAALVDDDAERRELAELNLLAGRKAKASAAYGPAAEHFDAGLRLLPPDSWQRAYRLALDLHTEASTAAYLNGDTAAALALADTAIRHARSALDKVPPYEARIQAANAQRDSRAAVDTAIEVLRLLGVALPETPGPEAFVRSYEQTRQLLAERPLAELIELPPMVDPVQRAIMRIVAGVADAAYHVAPDLLPLLVFEQIRLTVTGGLAPEASVAFALFGLMLCGVLDDIDTGYQAGRLALAVLDRLPAEEYRAKTTLIAYNCVMHWKDHIRDGLGPLLQAYQSGLATGDVNFAAVAAHAYCYNAYFAGRPLEELSEEMAAYDEAIAGLGQLGFLNYHRMYFQTVANLLGRGATAARLRGPIYDHEAMLPANLAAHDITALFVAAYNQCVLAYLFHDYRGALEQAEQAAANLAGAVALGHLPLLRMYDSLARLGLAGGADAHERELLLATVDANQQQLAAWAAHAPENHAHRVALVAAEQARVAGRPWEAAQLFEQAIAGARGSHYIQEEALAYELAAQFYLERDMHTIARAYLLEARQRYRRWQATAKLRELDERYPQWPDEAAGEGSKVLGAPSERLTTTARPGAALDLAAVLKVLQLVGGELDLERLLTQVMRIMLEHAGAERGWLVLRASQVPADLRAASLERHSQAGGDAWIVQAEALDGTGSVQAGPALAAESSRQLPLAVFDYVARTSAPVVLDDASHSPRFAHDPYIGLARPRSVVSVPLLYQGRLIGIVHLENNLVSGAFTVERLEVLTLLAAQMAIAIENALLYNAVQRHRDHLEELVAERTTRLEQSLAETARLFAEAQQAKAVAEAASRSKGDFLANMSHELRTPLNAVVGFSQLLERDANLTASQIESVRLIHRSGEHLLKLINDVLEMSRVEAGRMTLSPAEFDLHAMLDDVELMFSLQAEERGLVFAVERSAGVPRNVVADEGKLRQVLINLLGNAVKFTTSGSVTLQMCESAAGLPGAPIDLQISVVDTGPGIAPDELEQLFEPFVQAGAGRASHQGTGLGLAISRRFAQLMGGDLTVQTEAGRGSTFLLDVPVLPVTDEAQPRRQARQIVALAPGQPAYRVLLADDNPEDRLLLRRWLEPLGFTIDEAGDGQAAIERWQALHPHLLLMDMRMPGLDGYTAAQRIRELPGGRAPRIVAVVTSDSPQERTRILALGCDELLVKPLHDEAIFTMLERVLGVHFLSLPAAGRAEPPFSDVEDVDSAALGRRLGAFSDTWRAQLRAATVECDLGRMLELIEPVREHDQQLAATLAAWADAFAYDRILALIDAAWAGT